MLMPTSDVAVAAARLRDARAALDDSADLLRRAADLDWDSAAGAGCRTAVGDLLATIVADAGTVDLAARVTAGVGTP
ncbi:hypothetical protein BCE75_11123 [Isoptericola sp. CG 20/1183]|uniref:Uncharacterized protein n=1 Tax=Isoptericola halotolerans TaxID=300560 RepID=A0ABX5EHW5_9MICO|nr:MULTISPECIES: hypothetical protein [Isoptericola]PRZ04102.1 hypothetical protein BCE75_11123 [Isoptericola sp. CG 20/1183]PRZ10073.1 hypothetical protein BCL65_101211 [Isoptericola halotolerans]